MTSPDPTNAAPTTEDALALLRNDHRRIRDLFGDLALLGDGDGTAPAISADRHGALARLAARLRAHDRVEEEMFHPALEGLVDAQHLARSAADHVALEAALAACSAAEPGSGHFDRCVAALAELFNSHVHDEEHLLFAAAASLDLDALGTRMALRLNALTAEAGSD